MSKNIWPPTFFIREFFNIIGVFNAPAATTTFFALNKYGKYLTAGIKVNQPCENFLTKLLKDMGKNATGIEKAQFNKINKFVNKTLETFKSDKKMLAI